jgi:hypothetical protein
MTDFNYAAHAVRELPFLREVDFTRPEYPEHLYWAATLADGALKMLGSTGLGSALPGRRPVGHCCAWSRNGIPQPSLAISPHITSGRARMNVELPVIGAHGCVFGLDDCSASADLNHLREAESGAHPTPIVATYSMHPTVWTQEPMNCYIAPGFGEL